ncbi:MAG TPA: peptidoglycan editing factor PgeF [Vicinamibacteria bacterium]|nr:peptidoglycan editing factor PgeF [Vicinamibacteria bacterium]
MELRTATVPALSAVAGLAHGFEQRAPGHGAESRDECLARVGRALAGCGRLLVLKQVHGARVAEAPWTGAPEADAAVAAGAGWLLGIQTADCLPVLLVDPGRRLVAAAHAGWRGTRAGVAARAVEALVVRGSEAKDLVAAIGPGIGPCCYEVGREVRAAFGASSAEDFRPGPNGRPYLDLRAANARQLLRAGVRAEAVHHVEQCTRCRPDLYHSYRRDGRTAGRMISFVGFGSRAP